MIDFNDYYIYSEDSPTLLVHKKDRRLITGGTPVKGSIIGEYRSVMLFKKSYRIHRVIWMMHNGPIPEGMYVDHIDRDKMNNHIENLRLVTPAQNTWNKKKQKSASGLPKGIRYIPKDNLYSARIMKNGKRYTLSHKELEYCIEWLDTKRKELHGEFACSAF